MPAPDLAPFRALTFDCYGTLIDWESGILAVLRPWAQRLAPGATDAALLAEFARAEPMRESQGADGKPGFMLYPDVLRAVMRDIAAALGPRHSEAAWRGTVEDAAEALAASVGDWPAFPDTPAALQALKRRCKLVIVSNVDRASFARTNEKLGVEFDAIITAQDVRSYKPGLAHFHRALETLAGMGVEKHQVLHVAQSLFHDHIPAKSLGVSTVWIRRGQGRVVGAPGAARVTPEAAAAEPDFEFETMGEFAAAMGV